jgi:hypothetical protein
MPKFDGLHLRLQRRGARPLMACGRCEDGLIGVVLKEPTTDPIMTEGTGLDDLVIAAQSIGGFSGVVNHYSVSPATAGQTVAGTWAAQEPAQPLRLQVKKITRWWREEGDPKEVYRVRLEGRLENAQGGADFTADGKLDFRLGSGWTRFFSPPIIRLYATFEFPGSALGFTGPDAGTLQATFTAAGHAPEEQSNEALKKFTQQSIEEEDTEDALGL